MRDRTLTKQRVTNAVRRRVRRVRGKFAGAKSADQSPVVKRVAGVVEQFDTRCVTGWLAVATDAGPVRVSLCVNALEVAATWATDAMPRNNSGEVRSFELRLRDLWTYCRKNDKVTVRVDGKSLPIAGHGMYLTPTRNGRQTLAELQERLGSGYLFGQTGRLQLSKKLDVEWQGHVMGLYERVRDALAEIAGYDVFFIYGTLLGAVREGGVIGHDMDLDAAFVSRHRDGADAAAELAAIAYELIDRGFNIDCRRTALHIYLDAGSPIRIDLFHLYFDREGKLSFPFGVAGASEVLESDWRGVEEIEFLGHRGMAPVNAEAVAEHIYGAGWRSPKPGFDWRRDRTKRASEGILPIELCSAAAWSNFYAHHEFNDASTFAHHVVGVLETTYLVLDLGCGEGRDARLFAAASHPTVGVDRSSVGVRKAIEHAAAAGLGDATFQMIDLGDAARLRRLIADARREHPDLPMLLYLRFLLHAVQPGVQETIMDAVDSELRAGDLIAAEFRTRGDESLPKNRKAMYRRFLDGAAFSADLCQRDFVILDEAQGTDLAILGAENPDVYRVLARRSGS